MTKIECKCSTKTVNYLIIIALLHTNRKSPLVYRRL